MSGIRLFMMGTLGVVVLLWLQQRYPFSFPSSMHREPNLMKVNISLFDPTQWNADASVENGDIDTNTLVDALQLVEVQVPNNKDMTLAELRGGGSLGALTISAFAYLDVEHNCITPLSPFQETFTLPFDDTEDKMVLVGLTSEDALLHEYLNPPQQVMLWDMKRKKQSRIDFYSAFDAGSRLYCRPWYEKFLLLKKMCEQRTYYHGLFEKSTGGHALFRNKMIEKRLVSSLRYHGWRAVDDYKEASVLLGSFNEWDPTFVHQDPLIMRALIIKRNIGGLFGNKFHQLNALKKLSVEKPCVDLKHIIPTTYSASDPEDCEKIKELFDPNNSSSKSWLRKVGNQHRGQGVELAHQMHPDDCQKKTASLSGRSVSLNSILNGDPSGSVLYQEMIEVLKINGRASSFRMYLLLASLDPLVAFTNFQNGHVYINNREDKAWYTQGGYGDQEYCTFEMLDEYMLETRGISNFFATHIYPQWQHIVDVLLEILKPLVVGGKGHFEIPCFDLVISNEEYKLYLLEVNHGCRLPGEGDTHTVPQRMHVMTDTVPVIMEVQGKILSDRSVMDLVSGEKKAFSKGNYELVYSNQPGASYERSVCFNSNATNPVASGTQEQSHPSGKTHLISHHHHHSSFSKIKKGSESMKVNINLFDPTQWNADASVENGDIDTNTLVDALQLVEVQVPNNKDMTLAELRGGGSLGALTISAFAYLDVEHNCITPLSPFQETFTLPFDDTEDKMVLVGLTSEDALLHEYLNPPPQVMLWDMKRKKQSRIDFYSAFDAGSRLYCRPWYEKFLLLKKLCEQRTYFHGLFEKDTHGRDTYADESIDKRLKFSLRYHGWKAVEDYKEASVLLGSLNEWKPTSVNRDPFLMKAIINRNIHELFRNKMLLLNSLKKVSVEKPCVDLKHIIPTTYSASDPEDCDKIKELFDPNNSSSKSWLRKVGNQHRGQGVELAHQMHPDDCQAASLSGRSVSIDNTVNGDPSGSVLYQEMIEALKINGRPSSIRMYLLLASFDPLVAFTNFQNAHVNINNREDKAWYTQGGYGDQEYCTFEMLDEYMLETRGISNFFATYLYPQWQHIVDVILEMLKPRLVGGKGHFEILCFDMMLSNDEYKLHLLEINQGCFFSGESGALPQRMHVMTDTIPVIMEVQGRILSDRSVMDLVDEERIYMHKGNYELVYSNQPGASYKRSVCFNSNATNAFAEEPSPPLKNAEHNEL